MYNQETNDTTATQRSCAAVCNDNNVTPVQLGYSARTGDYRGVQEETEK